MTNRPIGRAAFRVCHRTCAHSLLCLGLVSCFVLSGDRSCNADDKEKGAVNAQNVEATATKRPVILLTGFEPFGKTKPPNPSWEGIKALNGKEWKGYQLVCKQIPVIWGAPLEYLQDAISECHPVAIFAFGQGGKGSFTVESKASNTRSSRARDNDDNRAPRPTIVADGPSEFQSTNNCESLAQAALEKGYETRVSTRAGRYLCEEMLYTLEYLKSTRIPDADVLFCHVPPLDSLVVCERVTPEWVREFVQDVLESWYTLHQNQAPPCLCDETEAADDTKSGAPEDQDVKQFIEGYFRSWSNQDMKTYGECFLPKACIQHIDSNGQMTSSFRDQFVASQREYLRTAAQRAIEVPESIDVRIESKLARAVVYWKLTAGSSTVFGYDHFTLLKQKGSWKIVNLVFYETKMSETNSN
jgi:pyroglutamyl-peptidase